QLVVSMQKVGFLDSAGLAVLVGALKRVRPHHGSLGLVCTRERILKTFKITGLTEVFGIYETVDQAIAAGNEGRPSQPGRGNGLGGRAGWSGLVTACADWVAVG
ncbi:MAG TPA: STAS domain-containing protein, partial [Streptosporangiaceae bacterium]|nr:STAS domain-containing protein [Streptosporangiaceae bacterium]